MENVHPFEKAGLGQAPFRCIGMWQMPSKSLLEQNPEAYNNAMYSGPKGLSKGCCDYCGTGIIYHYIIQDKTGHRFVVGSDCVGKTYDYNLIEEVKKVEKAYRQANKDAKRAEERKARDAARKARIDDIRKEWLANTPDSQAIVGFLVDQTAKDGCPNIWRNLLAGLDNFGNLTEGQMACVRSAIAQEAENALYGASEYLGSIGERISVDAKVQKIITVPCMAYHYGDRNSIDIYILKANGNIISWVSKTIAKEKKTGTLITEGMMVNVTATVKAHEVYKEDKQTKINRPSFKIIVAPTA